MRVVLTADTHVPKRARDLPGQLWAALRGAQAVIHAGDWVHHELLDRLRDTVPVVIGVAGNNDDAVIGARLPVVAHQELAGVRFAVVHDSGPARGREQRLSAEFAGCDVAVFGHSHIPWDTTTVTGLRLLNPGSPTDRRRQPAATFMVVQVEAGRLESVTLHRIPPRAEAGASGG